MNAKHCMRTVLRAIAPAAVLASSVAYAGYDPQLEDLVRAAQMLDLDARALVSAAQMAAGNPYNQNYQIRQAVQDVTVVSQDASQLSNSLQYNGQAEPMYHMLIMNEARMETSITILSQRSPSVEVALETVQADVQELRFWKECNLATGGLAGPLGDLTTHLKIQIGQTQQAAQMDYGYGNFWKQMAVQDLQNALASVDTLVGEIISSGTAITARDTQMLLSKAKRSIVRGGFCQNVYQDIEIAQQTMDQIQVQIRLLPPVYGSNGGYGQGGYGGGGYGSGGGTPPNFCSQYRRARPNH